MNQRKLLLNEKVEVRQFEKGLRGSWHPGVVVSVSDLYRSVEYDELLCETGDAKLIESISVSEAIEGLHQRRHVPSTYRGRIRPPPPPYQPESCQFKFHFGVCVDVWFEDAWWEGVVLDSDEDANERSVFFPDEGDERKFSVKQLRLSRVWDEFLNIWTDRGVWILVELVKELEGVPLSNHIKKVWSYLRSNYGFVKMISEWPCGIRNLWNKYYMDVIYEISVRSSRKGLPNYGNPAFKVRKKRNESKDTQRGICHLSDSFVSINSDALNYVRSKQKEEERNRLVEPKRKKWSLRAEEKLKQLSDPEIPAANNKTSQEKQTTADASVAQPNASVEEEEERNRLVEPKRKKWSLRSEEKLKQLSHPEIPAANNNTSQEKQTTADASVAQPNASVEGEQDQLLNDHSGLNKVVHSVSLPSQKQSSKIEVGVEKPKSLTLCEGETNQFLADSSRKKKSVVSEESHVQNNKLITKKKLTKAVKIKFSYCNQKQRNREEKILIHNASHFQKNQTIMRRNLTKPKKTESKCDIVVPTFIEKLRRRRASLVSSQKQHSEMKRRVSKKLKQDNSEVGCISKGEKNKLDAMKATNELDKVSASCHHSVLPFENYGKNVELKDMVSRPRKHKKKKGFKGSRQSDTICIVCHYGEDLIFCDCCPCSYHLSCIGLKDIPDRKWYCPSCCCGLCSSRYCNSDGNHFANTCSQCNCAYHVDCSSKAGHNPSESFCSDTCQKICADLHQLLGISNPTGVDGLTWTLLKSLKKDCNISHVSRIDIRKKLARALGVIHDCFEPVVEPHTKRDLARDVVFSSVSKLKRLDFRGFYVMVLQKGDEFACVATVRIHGQTAAEMPLVATDFQYRRQGMCRILMHEVEKLLTRIGVDRLVLPAISQLRETWETSFGFAEMPHFERLKLLSYPFLAFQGTVMFQKFLRNSGMRNKTSDHGGKPQVLEGNTTVSWEHNAGQDKEVRFCGLCYKRKSKTRIFGKENILDSCAGNNVQRYEYVYKRRRILANRDSHKGG